MAIPGATQYLQHWILAAFSGHRVHAARLISLIKVLDDLYIQFSKFSEADALRVLVNPFTELGIRGAVFMGALQKIFYEQNKKSPCEILGDSTRATGWFYSVLFGSRCDKALQTQEDRRERPCSASQRSLKVVLVVVPEVVP